MKSYFSGGPRFEFHYGVRMRCSVASRALCLGATFGALFGAGYSLVGDEAPLTNDSPYQVIVKRNIFDIKPPEPPPPPAPPPAAPPPPPSNIFLTGIMDADGVRQVYLSVNKALNKGVDYLVLKEGETQDEITVVSIDSKAEVVRLRNSGNEVTLNFKDNSLKPAAGGLPAPGAVPGIPGAPGAVPGVPPPAQPPRTAAVGGTGGGPVVVGKRGEIQQPNTPTVMLNSNGSLPGGTADVGQAAAATSAGVRELPVRRARVDVGTTGAGVGTTGSGLPEGTKIVAPPNFLPPLPPTSGQP